MPLWLEREPRFIPMMPNGYMDIELQLKQANVQKPVKQTLTLIVEHARAGGDPGTALPADDTQVGYITNGALSAENSPLNQYMIEGYNHRTEGEGNDTLLIGNTALADYINTHIVARCCALQSRTTVYKKATIRVYFSKAKVAINGAGNLDSLRNYQTYHFTIPPSVCGTIDSNTPPLIGAIGINQYPKGPTEPGRRTNLGRQQDKPGRFLIRGCAVSPEDALRGTAVTELATFLTNGSAITSTTGNSLVPVINVMNDLWFVRAAHSAGYVRVAAQGNRNPVQSQTQGGAT